MRSNELPTGRSNDSKFHEFWSDRAFRISGYGHIAPKTKNGKVVTIFYAILGIPLMLLCLSNIGDVMASSFRFLYWKVCCYVCTKPPKKRRVRSNFARSYSVRQPGRYGSSRGTFRRSIRVSQRSADSALGLSESMTRSSYSDTDCRYNARRFEGSEQRRQSVYLPTANPSASFKAATMPRYLDTPVATPKANRVGVRTTQSLDRKLLVNPSEADRSPVLCNKYALDDLEDDLPRWRPPSPNRRMASKSRDNGPEEGATEVSEKRASYGGRSLPRRCLSVEGATTNHRSNPAAAFRPSSVYLEMEQMRKPQIGRNKRSRSNYPLARSYRREPPSPRIMSPMGFAVHRQIYADDLDCDYEYYTAAEAGRQPIKPVPIWLCVFLVVSYIFGGAFLFSTWEEWPFLDSAYFCFITLTTIGFGDFVPAYKLDAHKGIALCSLYLLFGIALLAMSFNLVQEEVINNVKSVAKRLGIIKDSDDEEEADEYDDYDAEYEDEIEDNELEG
ncbi:hypothetical protein KM043_007266 [Ampulex compressa]|nr:hypothetical protein KM043_007266 [Ampulex compressa]